MTCRRRRLLQSQVNLVLFIFKFLVARVTCFEIFSFFYFMRNRLIFSAHLTHQSSLNQSSQVAQVVQVVEVADDRKALRDALYQGIFHRHRRTIFAIGSFLRMLKSRNSQYNSIRSSSEGDDETLR